MPKFLHKLSEVCVHLCQLSLKEIKWYWPQIHHKVSQAIKLLVTYYKVMWYYNPGEQLTLQCNVSDKGLHVALLQQGQPIALASLTFTELVLMSLNSIWEITSWLSITTQIFFCGTTSKDITHKKKDAVYLMAFQKQLPVIKVLSFHQRSSNTSVRDGASNASHHLQSIHKKTECQKMQWKQLND